MTKGFYHSQNYVFHVLKTLPSVAALGDGATDSSWVYMSQLKSPKMKEQLPALLGKA